LDASLVKLLLLRLRGGIRLRLKELKTLRGLLFLLVTAAVIILVMKQSASPASSLENYFPAGSKQLREQTAQFMPMGLLAAYLLMVLISPSPALYFSPSEINLLFSGPFTRRALLLYKLCFYAFGALLSSLLVMLLVPASAYPLSATFLGAFLTMMFIQLLTVATGLLGQLPGRYIDRQVLRSLIIILTMLLVAVTGWYYADISKGLIDALAQFQSSTGGALILCPFKVFAHIFLAQSIFSDLLMWTMLGFAMNIGLIAAVILLDGYSCEASTAASLKLFKRWDHARRSGLLWGAQSLTSNSFMQPPMLKGIGPIAWRQILSSLRSSMKVLVVLPGMAALAGPLLVIASADISRLSLMGGVFFAAIFVLPRALVFDFRSDLEIMENFKALPLPAWKISIGQLATPVLLTSLIEWVLLGSAAILLDGHSRLLLFCISPFMLPFNMLLYGLENLFFLLFPAALVPIGRMDFDFLGRTMVGFVVTSSVLTGSCLLAVNMGQSAVTALGLTWPAFVIVAWLSLTLIALMTLPLLSWAFKRFDVSLSQ
jgi:hypothetical protein